LSEFDSQNSRIVRRAENEFGWHELIPVPGEERLGSAPTESAKPILTLLHISDLHICDAQSPARVELLDRYADPHHPMADMVGYVGTYRAQEIMATQTLEALVQTLNSIESGTQSTRPVDAVVVTGDVTDNAQQNELSWYLTIMDGGEVVPDSGDPTKWEGAASTDPDRYDPSYWNPEGTPANCQTDFPRSLYGFPEIPGLMDLVRKPFRATGLRHTWFATHGNHDALLQGTVPPDEFTKAFALGSQRIQALDESIELMGMLGGFQEVGPASYPSVENAHLVDIKADERRRLNEPSDWAGVHLDCGHGHGLTEKNRSEGSKYWIKDLGDVRLVSLDTVNINGGWQGSLDATQFQWLQSILKDPTPKYFIILSHHPVSDLFNDYSRPGADARISESAVAELLVSEPRVILWLAGHSHYHDIRYMGDEPAGFWHVQTASNIDWPQQGRIVELLEENEMIVISTSVINHNGPLNPPLKSALLSDPIELAGLSRLLAANDWQRRGGGHDISIMEGEVEDRNRHLWINRKI
jgi:metallophosphoesterase (TIGR03767 family)